MAGAYETVTFDQLAQWAGKTAAELANLNYQPALKKCRTLIVADVKENFQGSHGPDGTPWPALAHPRPNSKGADKPLLNTGLLRASVTAAGGQGHYESIGANRLIFGTNLDYASTHQEGATITPKNAKNLAIPLTKEAARAGSPRNWAEGAVAPAKGKQGKVKGGELTERRSMLQLIPRPGRPSLLVEMLAAKGNKGERWIAHYLLLKSVTIPARPFLGMGEKLIEPCAQVLAEFTQKKAGGLPPSEAA